MMPDPSEPAIAETALAHVRLRAAADRRERTRPLTAELATERLTRLGSTPAMVTSAAASTVPIRPSRQTEESIRQLGVAGVRSKVSISSRTSASGGRRHPTGRRWALGSLTARTFRSGGRMVTASPAGRTFRSRCTSRSGLARGEGTRPSDVRRGAGRAPAGAGRWRGGRGDGHAATETSMVRCAWPTHRRRRMPKPHR
jgi:hypothetical protein